MKTALLIGGGVVLALLVLGARGGRGDVFDDDAEGGAGTRPAGGGGSGVFTDSGGSSLDRFKPLALAPGLAQRIGSGSSLSILRSNPSLRAVQKSIVERPGTLAGVSKLRRNILAES